MNEIKPVDLGSRAEEGADLSTLYMTEEQKELKDLQVSLKETKPIGNIVGTCKTLD